MKQLLPYLFTAAVAHAATDAEVQATLHALPIISEKCLSCHGKEDKIKGELNLMTREGFLKGGETIDNLLVPGDPDKSFLMTTIKWEDEDYEMPPKSNDRLNEEQIAHIETWIKNGAVWPDDETQKRIREEDATQLVNSEGKWLVKTSGGMDDTWTYRRYSPENLWAFQPLTHPKVKSTDVHPVDSFIQDKIKKAGFAHAPRADDRTLLRRLSYTLTGLPPEPTQLSTWLTRLEGDFQGEFSKIIDELLASPHYGERWAQHWLDVVRYADTAGFSNDFELSNAWRYRDYVIRSLNKDKPYNQFVMEQLAGDEMDPQNHEMKIATGFLRMGPWEHTAMLAGEVSRQQYLDDVVDNVGQVFLSQPMSCCKCHDHKFDPIPTRDYYRMYATFSTTQPAELHSDFLPDENRSDFKNNQEHVEALHAYAQAKLDKLNGKREAAAREWYEQRGLAYKNIWERDKDPDGTKPPRHAGLTIQEEGQLKVREQDVWIWNRRRERFKPLAQSVYNGGYRTRPSKYLRPPNPKDEGQMKAHNTLPEDFILGGGSVYSKKDAVTPGVLSALGIPTEHGSETDPYALPKSFEGRRLGFAKWVTHPENGLTTRSIVNRVWAYHFGRGIAGNPNNFGETGKKPTHPELLDYLANRFINEGWSLKNLHKLILTSHVWQQDIKHPDMEKLQTADPNNELLAYSKPRRLTAEELRDSLLTLTGELNPKVGGLPARPEINREVALGPRMIQFSLAPAYQPNKTPEERNRRSIYAYRIRGLVDPLMEVFNKPNADDSCEHRDAPNVTPQVFTLLNSEAITNRSLAMAKRLSEEASEADEQIKRAYHLAFTRQPTSMELETLSAHYQQMVSYHQGKIPNPVEFPTSITRSLVEEFSGEPFQYEELLDIYQNYTPDLQANQLSPEQRALADICLILFNTNELIYVY